MSPSLLDDPTRGPPYTTNFNAANVSHTPKEVIPTYRIMDADGNVIDPKEDPQVKLALTLSMDESFMSHSMSFNS